jgi:hypothetical protein
MHKLASRCHAAHNPLLLQIQQIFLKDEEVDPTEQQFLAEGQALNELLLGVLHLVENAVEVVDLHLDVHCVGKDGLAHRLRTRLIGGQQVVGQFFQELVDHAHVALYHTLQFPSSVVEQAFLDGECEIESYFQLMQFFADDAGEGVLAVGPEDQISDVLHVEVRLLVVPPERVDDVADPDEPQVKVLPAEQTQELGCVVVHAALQGHLYLLDVD